MTPLKIIAICLTVWAVAYFIHGMTDRQAFGNSVKEAFNASTEEGYDEAFDNYSKRKNTVRNIFGGVLLLITIANAVMKVKEGNLICVSFLGTATATAIFFLGYGLIARWIVLILGGLLFKSDGQGFGA